MLIIHIKGWRRVEIYDVVLYFHWEHWSGRLWWCIDYTQKSFLTANFTKAIIGGDMKGNWAENVIDMKTRYDPIIDLISKVPSSSLSPKKNFSPSLWKENFPITLTKAEKLSRCWDPTMWMIGIDRILENVHHIFRFNMPMKVQGKLLFS